MKILARCFIFVLFFSSTPSLAAVAYDDSTASALTSFSHTATGSDRFAALVIGWFGAETISSVTYGGNAMTVHDTEQHTDNTNFNIAFVYIVNPPTGSQTVAITFSASPLLQGSVIATFTGVNQSTPFDEFNYEETAGDATSITNSVGSMTADDMMWAGGWGAGQPASTTTGMQLENINDGDTFWWSAITNTGTGTVSTAWSHGLSKTHSMAVRMIAAGGGGGASNAPRAMHYRHMRRFLPANDSEFLLRANQ